LHSQTCYSLWKQFPDCIRRSLLHSHKCNEMLRFRARGNKRCVQDSQTSADVFDVGSFGLPPNCGPSGAGGACTHSLLKYSYSQEGTNFTWSDLLVGMRGVLSEGGCVSLCKQSGISRIRLTCVDTV
jgi:hypothetical protein